MMGETRGKEDSTRTGSSRPGRSGERVRLKNVKNFGPVCLREFHAMGIEYLDQIERLGFEETCRLWVERYPVRLNANAFLGVACVLDGVVWTKASAVHRTMAHDLVRVMRREEGRPVLRRGRGL
jgi:hypothetical protein